MKLCLIPPKGLEGKILESDGMQLMLALPQLLRDHRYTENYHSARRFNDHIILDNGAAEGLMAGDEKLVETAIRFGVKEVVAPDAYRDSTQTLEIATAFARKYKSRLRLHGITMMAVPQGNNRTEMFDCMSRLINTNLFTTIGIPRHIITAPNDEVRIDLAEAAAKRGVAVHFLGTSPLWVSEMQRAARVLGSSLRSCDTSAPFNYAIAGVDMGKDPRKQIWRPEDYFTYDWFGKIDIDLLARNIQVMRGWAWGV